MPATHFIAADIGNARIKLGLFAGGCADGLPEPLRTLPLLGDEPELETIEPWLADIREHNIPQHSGADIPVCLERGSQEGRQECLPHQKPQCLPHRELHCLPHCQWWIASVNLAAATRLIDWLAEHRPGDRITLLACGDLPLEVRLPRPDMVGIDRLVDAVAVNRLRQSGRAAVIVDVGTAITVDLVSPDGAFLGGAILPGIEMSARAMHEFTDLLPLVDVLDLTAPPPALGIDTESAMQSGLFWGAVGAIRQVIEQLHKAATAGRALGWGGSSTATPTYAPTPLTVTPTPDRPQIFLTGGAGAAVAELLGPEACYVPNLTLAGIALAAKVEL